MNNKTKPAHTVHKKGEELSRRHGRNKIVKSLSPQTLKRVLKGEPSCAIGVDVGGTKIAAALVSLPGGEVRFRRQVPTIPARGGKRVFEDVLLLCGQLAGAARRLGERPKAIGIGICELVDKEGNVVSESSIAWKNVPVRKELSRIAPTHIEADVRAAAIAEATFGVGKPFHQFLYLTVGTGISCCLMLDGKPFMGAHGATGSMASGPLGLLCDKCGNASHWTLEEISSGPALVARYQRHSGTSVACNGEAVLAAAVRGDTGATHVVQTGGEMLGSIAGWLINVLDPEAVVVGGGLGLSKGLFWESFLASTRRHIWFKDYRNLPILPAATGTDAGVIGAALAACREHQASALSTSERL